MERIKKLQRSRFAYRFPCLTKFFFARRLVVDIAVFVFESEASDTIGTVLTPLDPETVTAIDRILGITAPVAACHVHALVDVFALEAKSGIRDIAAIADEIGIHAIL